MKIHRHPIESSTEKVLLGLSNNAEDNYEEDRKKKLMPTPIKFNNGIQNYQQIPLSQIHFNKTNRINNELSSRNFAGDDFTNYDEEELEAERSAAYCPLIEAAEKRCRKVEIMNGDIYGELLSVCGIHQICYLCVSNYTHNALKNRQ